MLDGKNNIFTSTCRLSNTTDLDHKQAQPPCVLCRSLTTTMQEALSQADRQLSKSQRQASHAGKRLRALESRDEQLQSLWASNKRMTWAARVIQRHYKAWRMRNLQFENLSDKRVS